MTTVQCAGCTVQIEGSDVYYRPGDGSPVCNLCYLGVDRKSVKPAVSAPPICVGCQMRIAGTVYHRAIDYAAVCETCYPRSSAFHDLPKARYHSSNSNDGKGGKGGKAAAELGGAVVESLLSSFTFGDD